MSSQPKLIQVNSRFYLYEPKSRLFIKKDGVVRYWSVSDNAQKASASLTTNMYEAYSASSKNEADKYLKTIINDCSYASSGTVRGTVELDELLGCVVDNTAIGVIINVKWLVVKEATCTFTMEL